MAELLMDSSIQVPEPSAANLATYSLPLSRYLSPVAMRSVGLASAADQVTVETNLYMYSPCESSPM